MKRPHIVAMYRLKNEQRWIKKSLESVSQICSEIVVLDDGSTDQTLEICKNFPKVVDIHSQSNMAIDETRDRNQLLQMALTRNPDYIITLDGDEIIQPNTSDILFNELTVLYPDADIFEFQFILVWDKPNQYRCDGIRSHQWRKRLLNMKNQPQHLHFDESPYPGHLHIGGIPHNAIIKKSIKSRVKIFHYGYYDGTLRKENYKFYNKIDPNNSSQHNYAHILSGKGNFPGPKGLELKTLPNELVIDVE